MNPLALPGKVSKKYQILSAIKKRPRATEAVIGSIAGGSAGAIHGAYKNKTEKDKGKKRVLKDMLFGSAVGGVGAVVGNQYLLNKTKNLQSEAKNIHTDLVTSAQKNKQIFDAVGKGNANARESAYEGMRSHKKDLQDLINSHKYWKDQNDLKYVKKYRKHILNEGENYRSQLNQNVEDLAKFHADNKARKNFVDKYVNAKEPSAYNANKDRIFGGARGVGQGLKEIYENVRKAEDHNKLINRIQMQGAAGHVSLHTHPEIGVDLKNVKKTKEFKNDLRNLRQKAYQDVKANRKSDNFDTMIDLSDYSKILGHDLNNIKTKKEFNNIYHGLAKKYHPDINKDPRANEKLKGINDAADRIKKSDWFEKLSAENIEFEKHSKLNYYKIKE